MSRNQVAYVDPNYEHGLCHHGIDVEQTCSMCSIEEEAHIAYKEQRRLEQVRRNRPVVVP